MNKKPVISPIKDSGVVAVVGAGPAGLVLALILADAGIRVALFDQQKVHRPGMTQDNRTAALLRPAVDILCGVQVNPETLPGTAMLKRLRLVDVPVRTQDKSLSIEFDAGEIHEPYFALNIRNAELHQALVARVTTHKDIQVIAPCDIHQLEITPCGVSLKTDQGVFLAILCVGADGKSSRIRDLAGIGFETIDYQQVAFTFMVGHTNPHNDTSIEFHRPGGPCTFVPQPGNVSSVVWLNRTLQAETLRALPANQLIAALQCESQNILGDLKLKSNVQGWDITWTRAQDLIGPRVALVAEAAHALPPSGAQGLNLSFEDITALAAQIMWAHRLGLDLGSQAVLSRYAKERAPVIAAKSRAVDGLNRLILTHHSSLRRLRRLGLYTAASITPIRQAVMKFGWLGG